MLYSLLLLAQSFFTIVLSFKRFNYDPHFNGQDALLNR